MDDLSINNMIVLLEFILHKTNRFYVAMYLVSIRSQRTEKSG